MCILAENNPNGLGRGKKGSKKIWFIHWWVRRKTTEHLLFRQCLPWVCIRSTPVRMLHTKVACFAFKLNTQCRLFSLERCVSHVCAWVVGSYILSKTSNKFMFLDWARAVNNDFQGVADQLPAASMVRSRELLVSTSLYISNVLIEREIRT